MASVKKRRLKGGIAYYGKFDNGTDPVTGKTIWKVIQTGQPTWNKAAVWIENHEKTEKAKRENPQAAPVEKESCATLMQTWAKSIKNRNAEDDRARLKLHLLPHFGQLKIDAINQPVILNWIDAQRATPKKRGKGLLSESSIRHHLNLLSRFFSWCVPRHLASNPIRDISTDKRPQSSETLRGELPWIEDDKTVRELYAAMPEVFGLMFYIGNRTGARLGEICGLRLSSFDRIDSGTVRLRWTYDNGFLKEDKRRTGKSKDAPVPPDLIAMVKSWIERRKTRGATSESLMFPNPRNKGKAYRRLAIERAWIAACDEVEFMKDHADDAELPEGKKRRRVPWCTFYEGTRHSFVSRNLRDTRGRALYEIAMALGHADTTMIAKHYGRWIVREFSMELRGGIGLKAISDGKMLPFPGAATATESKSAPEGTEMGTRVENGGG